MYSLSVSYVATPSAVVFLNIRQFEFHLITIILTRVILFCVFETVHYLFVVCAVVGCGLSFLCCTLSCSVFLRICVQSGRVQMEYRCGDNYGRQ